MRVVEGVYEGCGRGLCGLWRGFIGVVDGDVEGVYRGCRGGL